MALLQFKVSRCSLSTVSTILLLLFSVLSCSNAQSGTQISVGVDMGENLIYLLLIIFFMANLCTPVARFLYVNYLESMVEKGITAAARAQKKLSDRLSDAQRKVSQSIRS